MKIATFHLLSGEVRQVAFDPGKPCTCCGKPRERPPLSFISFQRGLCYWCDVAELSLPRKALPAAPKEPS